MSSATILSSTSQPDGGATLSSASAYSLDAVVQAECVNPATPLTMPCLATLLLSGDGGATFVAADTRRFDLLAATTTLTFTLADYADRKFPGTNQWQTVAGTAAAVGVLRTFRPPWTHFQVQTSGNIGGAVTVSAIGDSGALSGGGGSIKIGGWTVGASTALQSGSGLFPPVIAAGSGVLSACQVAAETNPSGGGFSFQITKNGTNIFSSPQTVPASTTTVVTFSSFSVASFGAGDVFLLIPSSVGTGVRGVTFQLVD